jgi:hypothetical protein
MKHFLNILQCGLLWLLRAVAAETSSGASVLCQSFLPGSGKCSFVDSGWAASQLVLGPVLQPQPNNAAPVRA